MRRRRFMKKNSENILKEVHDFFDAQPNAEEKAWGLINDFYHLILSYMEKQKITRATLARKLKITRAAVSHMFNKTPNVTIKKMVEIADAVGIDLKITSDQVVTEYTGWTFTTDEIIDLHHNFVVATNCIYTNTNEYEDLFAIGAYEKELIPEEEQLSYAGE